MQRNKIIDIIKAIGIILMLLGHSGFEYTNWIYQFHMALFFLVAGYCFNDKYIEDKKGLIKLLKSRVLSLYIPCLLFNSAIVLCHNFFLKFYLISGNYYNLKDIAIGLIKCLLFSGGENLSGAMWFLRTMFFSTIIFALIQYITKHVKHRDIIRLIIYTTLLVVGYYGSNLSFGKYLNIFSVLILIYIGKLLKEKKIATELDVKKSLLCLFLGFFTVTISILLSDTNISLMSNRIINPLYFICCSLGGFLFALGFANLLKRTFLSKGLEYIGKNTLSIVMWHFLAMKIVTLIQIVFYKESITLLSYHPYLHTGYIWCILYTIVGISIPLLLHEIYLKLKKIK